MRDIIKKLNLLFIITVEFAIFTDVFVIIWFLLTKTIDYSCVELIGIKLSVSNLLRPFIVLFVLVVIRAFFRSRRSVDIFKIPEYYLALFLILYCAISIPVLLNGYYSFRLCGIPHDFSLQHQAVYNTIHGAPLKCTLTVYHGYLKAGNWNILGDHFYLFLLLLAPIYYFCQEGSFLIVLQFIAISFSAIPLYLIAKDKLRNRWIASFISITFLIYPFTIKLFYFGFHADYFAIPLFLLAFYFLEKSKMGISSIFILLASITKENSLLIGVMFGLYILIFKKDIKYRFIWGGIIILIGILLYIVYTKYIIAHFSNFGPAWHSRHLLIQIKDLFKKPWLIVNCWGGNKREYFLSLFYPLGFIPLLSPMLFLGFPNFLQNLITTDLQTTQHLWHTDLAIPFIFIGFIYGIQNLLKITKKYPRIEGLIFIWIIFLPLCNFHTYFNSFLKNFLENKLYISYKPVEYKNFEKIKNWLSEDNSVFTINAFLPNLSNRKELYWLFNYYKTEEIDTEFVLYAPSMFRYEENDLFILPVLSQKYEVLYDNKGLVLMARKDVIKKETISFAGEDIYNFEFSFTNVKMEYYLTQDKGLCVQLYLDGGPEEDEFSQIRMRNLNLAVNKSNFQHLCLIYEVESPKVQTFEVVLGLDLNNDGKVDKYIKGFIPEKINPGINRWDISLEDILEDDVYEKDKVSILEIEIYPHKIWWTDCRSYDRRGKYKYWIYKLEYSAFSRK